MMNVRLPDFVKGLCFTLAAGILAAISGAGHSEAAEPLTSHIRFSPDGDYVLDFASLAEAPELSSCPINDNPKALIDTTQQLGNALKDSLKSLQDTDKRRECTRLLNTLNSSKDQLNKIINPTLAEKMGSSQTVDEQKIKDDVASQRAAALSQVVGLGTDILDNDCLGRADNRVLVQRMIGQAVTLGGIAYGGWPGVAFASGGQILGRFPLFRATSDKAADAYRQFLYDTSSSSFLCLYREIQRGTTLLFPSPGTSVVRGVDLSDASKKPGTSGGFEALKTEQPRLYHEVVFTSFAMENGAELASIEEIMSTACPAVADTEGEDLFVDATVHPPFARNTFLRLRDLCADFSRMKFPAPAEEEALIKELKYSIKMWKAFNRSSFVNSDFKKASEDYARQKAEEKTQQKLESILKHESSGNQLRLQVFQLTEDLGKTLALDSFKNLIASNKKLVTKRSNSVEIRQRALMSMLDLCKTFDPTLAALYIETQRPSKFLKNWLRSCVSDQSTVCSLPAEGLLATEPGYEAYYRSLCGHGSR